MHRMLALLLLVCTLAAPTLAQAPPGPGTPTITLGPPPGTDKPDDPGEPPGDPEGDAAWLTKIFFHMMDTNGDGVLSEEELAPWVLHVDMPMGDGHDGMPGEGDMQAVPAFPTVFWDFDDFVGLLGDNMAIINFDAFPDGPATPTDYNIDCSLAGTQRSGMEWGALGAVFYSPTLMSLRTVGTLEPEGDTPTGDPQVELFVSRPNSLSVGTAPYCGDLQPQDNNNQPDNHDDSLTIELDPPRAAVGFYLLDQDPGNPNEVAGEGIQFLDAAGNVIEHVVPLPTAIYPAHQFVGLMSFGNPIQKILIQESNDSDSMTIDHVVLSQ